MWLVSWQPGAFKGKSKEQTDAIHYECLKDWQAVCGVRFGIVPFGSPSHITIYPYDGPMQGFAVTYMETRQILYSTRQQASSPRCVMAMMHEVGHAFGWHHVSRQNALMNPYGSPYLYLDAQEAVKAWNQFGKYRGHHWPKSLRVIGEDIRESGGRIYNQARENFEKFDSLWTEADKEWQFYVSKRPHIKNPEVYEHNESWIRLWYSRREDYGKRRLAAHSTMERLLPKLKPLWKSWGTVHNQWRNIGGIHVSESLPPQEIYSCFGGETATQNDLDHYKLICERLPLHLEETDPSAIIEVESAALI